MGCGASMVRPKNEELVIKAGLKSRQSVHEWHDWRRKGRLVGWRNARRGYVFPAVQLDGA